MERRWDFFFFLPHTLPVSKTHVFLHDLCHRVCESQLSYVVASAEFFSSLLQGSFELADGWAVFYGKRADGNNQRYGLDKIRTLYSNS